MSGGITPRDGALGWAWGFGRAGRKRLALAALLGALASGAAVGLAATSAWLISRASEHPPVLYLMVAIVAVRTFGIARGLLRYGERLAGHDATFRILGDLRAATVERLERVLPLRRRADRTWSSGDLLARFVADVDGLQDLWVRIALPYAAAALVGAATVVLVLLLVPAAGAALAASLLVAALVAPWASARIAAGSTAELPGLRARYESEVIDLLDGAGELAVYGALDEWQHRLDRTDAAITRRAARSARAAGAAAAIAVLAAGAATWAGLWFGAGAVRGGSMAAVGLAVVTITPLAIHEVVSGLAPAAHALPHVRASAERVREVFEQPDAVREPPTPRPLPAGPHGIRMRAVRAGWDGTTPVLDGADLDLPAGTTTMIVGPSGSGKSTIAALLLRMLDPDAGSIDLVGGDATVGFDALAADDVRSVIGLCAQDAYVFDSTIEANLRLARTDASSADIDRALAAAGLADTVASLPAGLQTMVGEHGGALSGGQRQRLALARVLLADRPVVVFDEPTEHLDEPAAVRLASDLLASTAGRTVVVMTHRPELFPTIERIVRLEGGRLSLASPIA